MPKRYGPLTRKFIYAFLSKRDGERCFRCQRSADEVELVVAHRDGNIHNHEEENLELNCRRCNQEGPKATSYPVASDDVYERVSVEKRTERALKQGDEPPEMRVTREKEPLFRAWVLERVFRGPAVTVAEAVDGGAERFDVNPVTTRRWLRKMLSGEGILRLSPGRKGFQFLWLKEGYAAAAGSSKGKLPEGNLSGSG